MPSEPSFPQFSRLPAEVRLQILRHHLDNSLGRHHYFETDHYNVAGHWDGLNYVTHTYHCIDAATNSEINNDATNPGSDRADDCVYANDGLASERIPLRRSLYRQGDISFSHIWAHFATDVFTFEYRDSNTFPFQPNTFLGDLEPDPPRQDHWFWRIQKLALGISSTSLLWGYVLTDFDKDMLRRTRALKTVYVVANLSLGPDEPRPCSCGTTGSEAGAVPGKAHLNGFIAPEDHPLMPKSECPEGCVRYGTRHATIGKALRLKDELEGVFRGRSGDQSVEILVVCSPSKTPSRVPASHGLVRRPRHLDRVPHAPVRRRRAYLQPGRPGYVRPDHAGLAADVGRHGVEPFIHSHLYKTRYPPCVQDAYLAATSYLHLQDRGGEVTPARKQMVHHTIEEKVLSLLETNVVPSDCSSSPQDLTASLPLDDPLKHIARVHALLVYQLIGLFEEENVRLRRLAERHIPVLYLWMCSMVQCCARQTEFLGESVTAFPKAADASSSFTARLSCDERIWQTWIMAECARRTWVVISGIQAVYLMVRHQSALISCMGGMMVTTRKGPWDAASAQEWLRICSEVNVGLVQMAEAHHQFSSSTTAAAIGKSKDPDEFIKFALLVGHGERKLGVGSYVPDPTAANPARVFTPC
ncbi:hypothetical protein PG997_002509 [Apiospora hydei]|uniref:Transcription factor domain-containing protein n=1 Tax=Apiospora hydei TaxID=1337664 RepID=A0ABR1WWL1_9PEZI